MIQQNSLKMSKEMIKHMLNILLFFLCIYSVLLFFNVFVLGLNDLFITYGVLSVLLIVYLNVLDIQRFGPLYTIFIYNLLTHLSYPLVYVLSSNLDRTQQLMRLYHISAMYVDHLQQVFSIAFIGLYSFLFGVYSYKLRVVGDNKTNAKKSNRHISIVWRKTYMIISLILIFFYALVLVYYVRYYNLLNLSYLQVKNILGTRLISYSQNLFWISIVPLVVLGKKRELVISFVPISIIFIILFFSGNRNDILIPLIVAFSIYTLKNKKVLKIPLIVGFAILFVISPIISATRSTGSFTLQNATINTKDSILEMSQLRPLTVMFEKFSGILFGLSILLPTFSLFNLNIFYSASDFRSSAYHIGNLINQEGYKGLAFTMIGEIYWNFWIVGVLVIFFILGRYMRRKEATISHDDLIPYGQFSILIIFWIRNSLEFGAIIIIFSVLLHYISKILSRK